MSKKRRSLSAFVKADGIKPDISMDLGVTGLAFSKEAKDSNEPFLASHPCQHRRYHDPSAQRRLSRILKVAGRGKYLDAGLPPRVH